MELLEIVTLKPDWPDLYEGQLGPFVVDEFYRSDEVHPSKRKAFDSVDNYPEVGDVSDTTTLAGECQTLRDWLNSVGTDIRWKSRRRGHNDGQFKAMIVRGNQSVRIYHPKQGLDARGIFLPLIEELIEAAVMLGLPSTFRTKLVKELKSADRFGVIGVLNELEEWAESRKQRPANDAKPEGRTPDSSSRANHRVTVNQPMKMMLIGDPRRTDWTATEWASKLKVSGAAVKQTKTWHEIMEIRAIREADRRRKPKNYKSERNEESYR